jgi:hypothetical protein
MPKFQALFNIKSLSVPFVVKDDEGNIIHDESINFNSGLNSAKGFIPAFYHTSDKDKLAYLRAYPGNLANGGSSFEEVEQEKPVVKKVVPAVKAVEPAPVAEPVVAEAPVLEEAKPEAGETQVFEDVTTVNEASSILRDMFPELKVRDVNTRDKVFAFSASKNLSFPNL